MYDNPYAGRCLIYLLEKKQIKKTDLLPLVNSHALDTLVDFLENNGIIDVKEEQTRTKTFHITLTEKGEAIANLYSKMQVVESGGEDETNYGSSSFEVDKMKE